MPFTPSSFMSLALRDSTLEVSWFLSRTTVSYTHLTLPTILLV